MSTMYSVGQMNQLADALETAGFVPDDVTKLRSFPGLREIKKILAGFAEIVTIKHLIDCDADPYLPKGWKKVVSHKKGGMLEWNPAKVYLHLSLNQQNGKTIQGHNLRKELENEPVLNANVLDYLLAHPELILEEWKGKYIFFWGTIYRGSGGRLYVRYLRWGGGAWNWGYNWLDDSWDSYYPVACSQVSS